MIERTFVKQKVLEYQIKSDIYNQLRKLGVSSVDIQKTPLYDKIIIKGMNPGKLVGRGGANIRMLTEMLKEKYKLENPQVEVKEEENPWLNARLIAEKIAKEIEVQGVAKFKSIVHKNMVAALKNGAQGIFIRLSGRVPSDRGVTWAFQQGYIKKCGNPAKRLVSSYTTFALIKTGTIGVKVKVMPKDVELPDRIQILDVSPEQLEELKKTFKQEKEATEPAVEEATKKKKKSVAKKAKSTTKKTGNEKSTTKRTKTKKE